MKVIVRGKDGLDLEFDTKDVTVLVMLTEYDTDKIRRMPSGQGANYCVHPDNVNNQETQAWMQQRVTQIVQKEEKERRDNPPMTSPN